MRAFALGLALLTIGCATPEVNEVREASATAILAKMRAACGGRAWDRVRGWHETGIVDVPGRPRMSHEIWHDMTSLKTAMVNRLDGRIVRRAGFDGSRYWQSGPDGRLQIGSDPAILRKQRRDAYLSSSGWFFRSRFPAEIVVVAPTVADGKRHHVLRITPAEAGTFDLWVDQDTYRVRRIVADKEYAELTNYRMFDGICSATHGRQGDGEAAHEIVLHVQTVDTDEPVSPQVFVPGGA